MGVDSYWMTWKSYEKLMILAIESAISEAGKAIDEYKRNTFKEIKI